MIEKFLKLFDGYTLAYGQHSGFKAESTGKLKGRANTIIEKLPKSIVEKHLNGTGASLGLVPLKENNKCKFATIDLDIVCPKNPLIHSMEEMEDLITKLQLPLVVCQSKSKGIHLYCFTKTEVPAKLLIKRMREWAVLIGYGAAEVFPKQSKREEGRIGNWINLPYFDSENTVRYCMNKHKILKIEEFFNFAEHMRISLDELKNFKIEPVDEEYNDAPPCLQTLLNKGIEDGTRNEGLFNFAVYFRQKYPDSFEEKIMEINGKLLNPPLRLNEVEGIIKAVNKKKYFYRCNEYPICQYCNKDECHKRKYGIGADPEMKIEFTNLTKYISNNEVIYYVECENKKIKLTTEELFNQKFLQKRVFDQIGIVLQPMKQVIWLKKLNELGKTCITIDDPNDASKKGQFKILLDSFLTSGTPSDKKSHILNGSIYLNKKENLIYFQSTSLFSYLQNHRFKYLEQEVWHWLKELGVEGKQIKISNIRKRVWIMDCPEFFIEEENDNEKV